MNFKDYYKSVQKTFKFRIKTLCQIDDETMDAIEAVLAKYRPVKFTKPKKTMFHTNPLGFTGTKAAEVYYVDVELSVPGTSAILAYDLRTSFGIDPSSEVLVVEGEHDNPEVNPDACDEDCDDKPALLSQDNMEVTKVNPDDYYGDTYNSRFLEYIKKVADERKAAQQVDAPHPITKWGQQPKLGDDVEKKNFNDYLKDQ